MSERTDQRDRPRPGRGGGLAGMMNVRQEAFQAVEVIVGLLEEIKERVNPPDRGESFVRPFVVTPIELLDPNDGVTVLGGQFSETLKIADASANARVNRLVVQARTTSTGAAAGGGMNLYLGGSMASPPLGVLEWRSSGFGLDSQGEINFPGDGIPAESITLRGIQLQVEAVGVPLTVAVFGVIPERD